MKLLMVKSLLVAGCVCFCIGCVSAKPPPARPAVAIATPLKEPVNAIAPNNIGLCTITNLIALIAAAASK